MLGDMWLDWHAHIGIFILGLIVFRTVWGFTGSTYARFGSFIPTPTRLKLFFSSQWYDVGHNPLGALSVFALLAIIFVQASFGMFSFNDEIEFHGPLYRLVDSSWNEQLTSWHRQLFNVLASLVALHLLAIVYYTSVKRKNLIRPMITGITCITSEMKVRPIKGGGIFSLLVSMAIAVLTCWIIESDILLQWLLLWFSQTRLSPNNTTILNTW